jgi:hypothetical protein
VVFIKIESIIDPQGYLSPSFLSFLLCSPSCHCCPPYQQDSGDVEDIEPYFHAIVFGREKQ